MRNLAIVMWIYFASQAIATASFASEKFDFDALLRPPVQTFLCVPVGAMHHSDYDEKFSPAQQEVRDQVFVKHSSGDGTGFKLTLNNEQNTAVLKLRGHSKEYVLNGIVTFQNVHVVNMAFDWLASKTAGFSGESYSQTTSFVLLRSSNEFFQSIITVDVHAKHGKELLISGGKCNAL